MIGAFFAKWGAKIIAGLVAVGAVLGALKIYGRGKKHEGASEEREKQTKKVLENVGKAKRVGDKPLSDADRRKLSKKYGRQ